MKIAKVHNYYLQTGGEDTVFLAETNLLRSRGHDVVEYLESNTRIKDSSRMSIAFQTLWSSASYHKLQSFLRTHKPDVVHFHNIFPLISPSAYYACQVLGLPVVQTLDNQRLICPSANFYRDGKLCTDCLGKTPPWPSILHACYHNSRLHTAVVASMLTFHRWLRTWQRKVNVFLCSTNFYRNLFVEAGLPAEKLIVMPHFVAGNPDSVTHKKSGAYALFIGRLDPEKGVKTLLGAWRHLDIPLKIRGGGQLEAMAKDFVKSNRMQTVEFVGRLEEQELSDLIANARFLVMPSEGYYETFGMVIIEAFSRGVPVLASNTGVATELVEDQKTGVFFEAGNPIDLTEKARTMWANSEHIAEMGMMALAAYQERFTPDRCYKTLTEVYEKVISSK